jgi:hypothetical protein
MRTRYGLCGLLVRAAAALVFTVVLGCGEDTDPPADDDASDDDGAGDDDTGGDDDASDDDSGDDDTGPEYSVFEQLLVDLPADSWYEAPDTLMRELCVSDKLGVHGVCGCSAIVTAWGGGAYDSDLGKMIIWGGGHDDYHGNEVYAFDLTTGSWERLTEPTLPPDHLNQDPLPDGRPVSRHSYDGLQYLAHAQRFFGFGGSRASDGGGTRVTWTLDVASGQWEDRQPAGADVPGMGHAYNLSSAYDPVTGLLFMHDPYRWYQYDHDANAWAVLADRAHGWSQQRAVVDPGRRLYLTLGGDELLVYDLDSGDDLSGTWTTTGGDTMIAAPAPGFDFDVAADRLVAWHGGAPYILDADARTWTTGSSSGAPTDGVGTGTYGRWRYIERTNVFILVNSVDANVYFYKHTAGGQP